MLSASLVRYLFGGSLRAVFYQLIIIMVGTFVDHALFHPKPNQTKLIHNFRCLLVHMASRSAVKAAHEVTDNQFVVHAQ